MSARRQLAAILLLIALAPASVAGQGRIRNARTETRSAAQGLEREVRSLAARAGVTWIGYQVPMVAGPRQMCCFDSISDNADVCCGTCRLESGSGVSMNTGDSMSRRGSRIALEPATEFLVMARLENGAVVRVRMFTPDCEIDAGAVALVWLTDVKPDDSVPWLTSIVLASPESGEPHDRAGKTALAAIALHNVASADRALESFVSAASPARPEWLRGETAFWLGSARGDAGARLLTRMIAQDPSEKVRDKVTFGLSVSKTPSALSALINAARNDQSRKVRGQALFWLAQKAGKKVASEISDAIENDPDTEVKKRAVFALAQLHDGEGVPRLIEVARKNRNPAVRKQAVFWLGQSQDPRALAFIEDVLTR